LVSILASLSAVAQTVPYPYTHTVISDGENLYADGGDVTVTFLGRGTAGDVDLLYYGNKLLFNNQTNATGSTYDLGNIPAGTLMTFTMVNQTMNWTFYTGAGYLNPDGDVHAYVVNNYQTLGTTYVGFEDTLASANADFNYADVQFTYTGVTGAVPEPTTVALAGLGTAGLLGWRRRK